jgi:myosin-5
LSINYCNERTLKVFTSSYFDQEKALFDKEGLSKYVSDYRLSTNEDIIRAIDNPKNQPKGIFQVLDEVVKANRTDGGFIVSVTEALKNSPVYDKSKIKNDRFKIEHSSNTVEYTVKDFVEKAKDELPSNILVLMCKSNPNLRQILAKVEAEAMDNTKVFNFVDSFKAGMNALLLDLERSKCHFMRCIKPNNEQQAQTWDMNLVFNQIRYLGIKDYLLMKKRLYPVRIDYKEFCKKYLELNYDINELFPELDAKPTTDFKEIAKKTYLKVYPELKDENVLLGKKRLFAHYNSLDLMDEKLKTLVN